MRLAEVLGVMGPMLEGKRASATTAEALYGAGAAHARDRERLEIYARFCQFHRENALAHVYSACRRVIERVTEGVEDAWPKLVGDYFDAHPMHHVELNMNGDGFAAFLADLHRAGAAPAWLAELADLEWWEWLTRTADDESDRTATALCLASTVEIRPYHFDLVSWLDDGAGAAEPEAKDTMVIFWRDRDGDVRRERLSENERAVLGAVYAGEAAAIAGDRALCEIARDLHAAGILVGPEVRPEVHG